MIGRFLDDEDEKQPETDKAKEVFQLSDAAQVDILNLPENPTRENTLELPNEQSQPAPEIKFIPEPTFLQSQIKTDFEPESTAETIRRSGLAWSAGVIFFGSVIFMMVIGWFFDLMFGSSPWGIVGGIVLGSIIGFVQFFRISSQIFNQNKY